MADVSHLLESRRSRIGRWAGAAFIACALHAGGVAVALMQPHEEEADETAGAVTIDLTPLPAPSPVEAPDFALAPVQQDFTAPMPEQTKQVEKKVEEDVPPVESSQAPDPEVALPKPQPDAKEEEVKEVSRDESPRQEHREATTTAQRIEAPPAPTSAPAKGSSLASARAQASWQVQLIRQLNRHKRVPSGARRQRGRWEVVVLFTIDRAGKVRSSAVTKTSGLQALDVEALELLLRVTFPPPPDELPGETFEYSLPIRFGVLD
jgi:periplasmic protein TonB